MSEPTQPDATIPYDPPVPVIPPGTTQDAVVVVPGIMGSELYDTEKDRVAWGLADAGWLLRAWTTPGGLGALHVRPEEREGRLGRIRATRLLRVPGWSPVLRGVEPYSALLDTVARNVAVPQAVREFPYDWRLPVAVNARLLARAAREHLEWWRGTAAHTAARRQRVDEREGRLVFVAHSMGGLLTLAALLDGGDGDLAGDTRGVLTLGTPFRGSVAATVILNSGRGAPVPLPHRRLRRLAATMPGLHDLLPTFVCLDEGRDVRALTPSDVASLGGDAELARESRNFHARIGGAALPGHRAVVGISQRTAQSLTLRDGVVADHTYCWRPHSDGKVIRGADGLPLRFNAGGDGTVHTESASPTRVRVPFALHHGALAKGKAALDAVASFLAEDEHLGPTMAPGTLGLRVPDLVTPGVPWTLRVDGAEGLGQLECSVEKVGTKGPGVEARLYGDGDALAARVTVPSEGLYRVVLDTDDGMPLTQLVLAGATTAAYSDDDPDPAD
ncbi:lipase/acyltransferase domain-containing protein [Streptomyces yaizuensis]|uniref:Alpha/beta fold hydrolase n=1 Tax=Streptomyces yaizuensis TaxID=2989713 RepID=A0ABQ5P1T3_9ACTN|nr:hypothetical protein [Streptomyces sp. YSPA8]GLF96567.1 alpha/beta fold hydrolase [Streptomyces sp. YSPA8]